MLFDMTARRSAINISAAKGARNEKLRAPGLMLRNTKSIVERGRFRSISNKFSGWDRLLTLSVRATARREGTGGEVETKASSRPDSADLGRTVRGFDKLLPFGDGPKSGFEACGPEYTTRAARAASGSRASLDLHENVLAFQLHRIAGDLEIRIGEAAAGGEAVVQLESRQATGNTADAIVTGRIMRTSPA